MKKETAVCAIDVKQFDEPALGFDEPALGFDEPALGFDLPLAGFEDPSFGYQAGELQALLEKIAEQELKTKMYLEGNVLVLNVSGTSMPIRLVIEENTALKNLQLLTEKHGAAQFRASLDSLVAPRRDAQITAGISLSPA